MLKPLLPFILFTPMLQANDFSIAHQNTIADELTAHGQRQWLIKQQGITVNAQSNDSGFLIYNQDIGSNGKVSSNIKADSWSGQNGGLVVRWTSESDYMFIAVRPENEYSSQLFFCINTMHTEKSENCHVLSKNFAAANQYNLAVLVFS